MVARKILLGLVLVVGSQGSAVEIRSLSAEQVNSNFTLVGVISESSSALGKRGEQGGIAVIKNTTNKKTMTIKVGSQLAVDLDYVVTGIKRNRINVSNGTVETHIAYNGSEIEKDSGPSPEEISQRRRERFQKYYEDYKKMLEEVNDSHSKADPLNSVGHGNYVDVSDFSWGGEKVKKEPSENSQVNEVEIYSEDEVESQGRGSESSDSDFVKLSDYYDLDQISNESDLASDVDNAEYDNFESNQYEVDETY